jgi:hypothetical protein
MTLKAMIDRMNRRERILSLAVGAVVFLVFNLLIWNWLLGAIGGARSELAVRGSALKEQEIFVKERELWAKRDQWLQKHQPVLKNSGEAQTGLLDELRQVAGKYNILIENPAIGPGETTPNHQAVFASIETKSAWPPLVHFLYDVQQPESFIAFDSVNLMIDGSDPTMMRGRFKIARWFAPHNKGQP